MTHKIYYYKLLYQIIIKISSYIKRGELNMLEILLEELALLNEAQNEANYNYENSINKLLVANKMYCDLIKNKIDEIKKVLEDKENEEDEQNI
jgi:hypothetical protein